MSARRRKTKASDFVDHRRNPKPKANSQSTREKREAQKEWIEKQQARKLKKFEKVAKFQENVEATTSAAFLSRSAFANARRPAVVLPEQKLDVADNALANLLKESQPSALIVNSSHFCPFMLASTDFVREIYTSINVDLPNESLANVKELEARQLGSKKAEEFSPLLEVSKQTSVPHEVEEVDDESENAESGSESTDSNSSDGSVFEDDDDLFNF
ncbi:MAG: hypothetical protein MHM6MM_006643 [Cercozoa sp. M6MM]